MVFQSTPVIADGRIGRMAWLGGISQRCFNPRPSLLTGESERRSLFRLQWNGFNPRPSLLTGESTDIDEATQRVLVSIHARHC